MQCESRTSNNCKTRPAAQNDATRGDERRGVRMSGPFWGAADESRLLAGDRTLRILSAPLLRDPPSRVGVSPTLVTGSSREPSAYVNVWDLKDLTSILGTLGCALGTDCRRTVGSPSDGYSVCADLRKESHRSQLSSTRCSSSSQRGLRWESHGTGSPTVSKKFRFDPSGLRRGILASQRVMPPPCPRQGCGERKAIFPFI